MVVELEVDAEHGFLAEGGCSDDAVDVQKETRETSSEVCKETFRHRPYLSLDVVRQVLIMMFLYKVSFLVTSSKIDQTSKCTLFLRALNRS